MAKENIFAYELFLSLNISDFNLFFVTIATPLPPEKSHPPLSQQPPSKIWGPVKPPLFLKIWLEAEPSPSPPEERGVGGGGCTLYMNNLGIQHRYDS